MVCRILHGLTTGSLIIFMNFFKYRLLQIFVSSYHDQWWCSMIFELCDLYRLDKLTVWFLVVCNLSMIIAFIPLTAGIIKLGICLRQRKGLHVVWVHTLIKKTRILHTCSVHSRLIICSWKINLISHHHTQPEAAHALVLPYIYIAAWPMTT